MLLDCGLLLPQGASWSPVTRLPLPESVQAIVAARLDGLPPDEKRLVRDAAVVGQGVLAGGAGRGPPRIRAGRSSTICTSSSARASSAAWA